MRTTYTGRRARVPGEGHRSHNEVRGEVYGSVVQAGSVQGGIHIGAPPAAVRQTPWQLPPLVRVVDRSSELAALERHRARAERDGRPALAAVSGLGGVGKTTVALRWLHGLRGRFPAGQLHADLGAQSPDGPEHPGEILARFLRALGIPAQQVPAMLAERTVLYRSLTADRSLVVLLDDAATAAQVRPLLPGGGSVVAVTSRSRLPGLIVDGCYPLHLEPLAPEAAVELLSDTLADGRVGDEPEDARTLVALCAGLPLAVRIAGARLAARPGRRIATMVRSLAAEHQRLEALAIDGDHSVRAALDLSYRTLPPPAARLYRLLGLHPGREFDASVASVLLTTEADAARALDILHEASLLVDAPGERHRFHDLVRLHAAERAREEESPVERAEAVRRIADHYLASATRAEEIIDPQHRTMARDYGSVPVLVADMGAGPDAALDWLERELPNLMAVVHQARSAGLPTVCWQLADALWPLFLRRKFHDDWCAAHREGLAAARDLGDTVAECRMLTSGGLGELDAGHPGRALAMFERAAELFLGRGDLLGHARTLNYRGLALRGLGRPDEAAGYFARAATELPDHGDRRAGALARLNLADLALTTEQAGEAGQTDEARQTGETEEARQAREARQIVWAEEAIRHAGAARTTLLDVGDTYNAARAATLLGRAQLAANRPGQAAELLSSALAVLRGMTANYETARAVEGLAEVSERRGQTDLARTHYQEALDLYASVGRSGYDEAEAVRSRLRRLERGGPDGS
ncbi:ATP-binding protein [Streptomyces ortus]|uniref:NB-ARC domain-containing protein n=1 Tax=Streptomyces ortus TaxID=2867268 RepID=A0ABT3V5S9_9ACTN|nr:tetratricopeptide repeat protein [Streptomyces ortus]MCX4235031.1 NB-ARC domain-containing protein [Streptomyces ortus]